MYLVPNILMQKRSFIKVQVDIKQINILRKLLIILLSFKKKLVLLSNQLIA